MTPRVTGIGGVFFKARTPRGCASGIGVISASMDPEGNRIELWEPPRGRFPE
jgi:predicted enzyme related to lactoylglutathione lyase